MKRSGDGPGPSKAGGDEFYSCIGKCVVGLSLAELDRITDHVKYALESEKGRFMFKKYLEQGHLQSDLKCLNMYSAVAKHVADSDREGNQSSEPLQEALNSISLELQELDDIPEFDLDFLYKIESTLFTGSRQDMLDILEETKLKCQGSLTQAHKGFSVQARLPCPRFRSK